MCSKMIVSVQGGPWRKTAVASSADYPTWADNERHVEIEWPKAGDISRIGKLYARRRLGCLYPA